MENLWTKINNEVPEYFSEIIQRYGLTIVKIGALETALVGSLFALLISIDRFSADIEYVDTESEKAPVYSFGNFLATKYDSADRGILLKGNTAEELVINDLIVIRNGLINKWTEVLEGDTEWIKLFEESKWYSVRKLNKAEETGLSSTQL